MKLKTNPPHPSNKKPKLLSIALIAALLVAIVSIGAPANAESSSSWVAFTDLNADADPLDGAEARVTMQASKVLAKRNGDVKRNREKTVTRLEVRNATPGEEIIDVKVHAHIGPCVAGDGAAAKGHYNDNGGPANDENEIWLDFSIKTNGKTTVGKSRVDFIVPPLVLNPNDPTDVLSGAQSIVVHEANPDGSAGTRLACVSQTFTD